MMKSDSNGPTVSIASFAKDAVGVLPKDAKLSHSETSATIAMRVLLGTMDDVARNIRRTEKLDMKSDTGDTMPWRRSWKKSRILTEWTLSPCRKQKVRYLYMNFKDLNDGKYR